MRDYLKHPFLPIALLIAAIVLMGVVGQWIGD